MQMEGMGRTVVPPNVWYYMGSESNYHYLHNEYDWYTRNVRISDDDWPLKHTLPLSWDAKDWVPIPLGYRLPGDDADYRYVPEEFARARQEAYRREQEGRSNDPAGVPRSGPSP
jgi:hypothetical protein